MNSKNWIGTWVVVLLIIPLVGALNYLVDPYGLYHAEYFGFDKIKQSDKIRLTKAMRIKEIKPKSICLGDSRTEGGYDPTHQYFYKPSYNLAVPGSSIYEDRLNFENALKQGNLEKVLLVVNYRTMTSRPQIYVPDFEAYFEKSKYTYLFSLDTLKDSLLTIKGTDKFFRIYLTNGQLKHTYMQKYISEKGGHLSTMQSSESRYYKNNSTSYAYVDTKKKTFPDFEKIVALCYENNIELDIVFGPSHIRQWEGLDHYLGIEKWLKWKKDIVISVNKVASKYAQKPFRVMDFSVYHKLTAEEVPVDKNARMEYHWEGSHYKNKLGLIVLDRLEGCSQFDDFGVELNLTNINEHLNRQRINRNKFIDVEQYKKNFSTYLNSK